VKAQSDEAIAMRLITWAREAGLQVTEIAVGKVSLTIEQAPGFLPPQFDNEPIATARDLYAEYGGAVWEKLNRATKDDPTVVEDDELDQ
jgi:hypothetical protein